MTTTAQSPLDALTPREREVLTFVAQGLSLPEIAEKLHRSLKTIETHRLSLGRKLKASNRVELTRIAIAAGLAPIEVTAEDPLAESAKNAAARHDLEGRARALQYFQQINDEVFSATGPTFLRRLVLSLTRVLGVRSATICLLSYEGDEQALTTLALCNNGVMLDPEKYFARCTPCEDVLLSGQACYVDNLAERFPEDMYLDQLGDTSYVGSGWKTSRAAYWESWPSSTTSPWTTGCTPRRSSVCSRPAPQPNWRSSRSATGCVS